MSGRRKPDWAVPTKVHQLEIHEIAKGITGLDGYDQAFLVFRFRDAVVGQAWLPVRNGRIDATALQPYVPQLARRAWFRLMAEAADSEKRAPSATVIVCTRDRTEDLVQCLSTLNRLAGQGHQIIVVDSCPSDDRTARLMAAYPGIEYLRVDRPGLGIARNAGLKAANGDIVALTDDDARVDPAWLPALLRNFNDPMVAVVTGITMPVELETEAQLWFEKTNGFARGFGRGEFDSGTIDPIGAGNLGAGVNMAIRRSVLWETGMFDEGLGPGCVTQSGDDHEFFYRVLAHGHRIVYDPAALVWHRHRRDWLGLRRTLYGYGVGVFAWWTHALLVRRELGTVRAAAVYFLGHHVKNLVRSVLRRRGCLPLDLAAAELWGALAGPVAYWRSRRLLRNQLQRTQAQEVR